MLAAALESKQAFLIWYGSIAVYGIFVWLYFYLKFDFNARTKEITDLKNDI
jgi:hypothetical protein